MVQLGFGVSCCQFGVSCCQWRVRKHFVRGSVPSVMVTSFHQPEQEEQNKEENWFIWNCAVWSHCCRHIWKYQTISLQGKVSDAAKNYVTCWNKFPNHRLSLKALPGTWVMLRITLCVEMLGYSLNWRQWTLWSVRSLLQLYKYVKLEAYGPVGPRLQAKGPTDIFVTTITTAGCVKILAKCKIFQLKCKKIALHTV